MEVIREFFEREGCYNFYLKNDNKTLSIIFGGNLDLYWSLQTIPKSEKIEKIMYDELKETFIITKENYFIYTLFEELYEDIKNAKIFYKEDILNNVEINIDEEIDTKKEVIIDKFNIMTEKEIEERNEWYKKRNFYKLLFDGEKIEWHSDEEPYDIANIVVIRKVDDNFILEFTRPKITKDKCLYFSTPGSISIRFRNSGSFYDPFNIIFMKLFNKLQEYNPEYHQIHIEEINYNKKKILKK